MSSNVGNIKYFLYMIESYVLSDWISISGCSDYFIGYKNQFILTSILLYNHKEIWHNTAYELLKIQLLR